MSLFKDDGIMNLIMQAKNYKKYFLPVIIIILATILRLYILIISNDCYKADPISRVMTAINWMRGISFMPSATNNWLPLHFYIMGIGLKIFNNPFFTPRFISFLFGIGSLIIFYKLVDIIFGQRIAFLSLCLLAFYPIHIICSVVSLSEIIFLCSLLLSVYFCFKYATMHKPRLLFFSLGFLVLACMTRYEAWLFIFLIPLVLCFQRERRWWHIAIFFILSIIFPLFWTAHFESNLLLSKYTDVSPLFSVWNYDFPKRLFYWPVKLSESFGPAASLSTILGLFFSFRAIGVIRYYSILFLGSILFFIFGTVMEYVSIDNTYSISFGTMMIPLAIYGMLRIADYIRFKSIVVFLFMVLTVGVLMLGIIVPACGSDVNLVADYLKYHTTRDDKVLVDTYNLGPESYYIILFSRFSYGENTTLLHRQNREEILDYINREKPDYIVYSERGVITKGIIDLLSPRLTKILTTDMYTVYRLTNG